MKGISNRRVDTRVDRIQKLATFYTALYTGKGQEDILLNYRQSENDIQKKQRKRLTKTRTKHVIGNIENVFDKLRVIDKATINIKDERLLREIRERDIEDKAFEYVKYYNLTDPNAFIVFGQEEDDYAFKIVKSSQIKDYQYDYDKLKYLWVKSGKKDFVEYLPNAVNHYYKEKREGLETVTIDEDIYYKESTATPFPFAFRLGYLKDVETEFSTAIGLLEKASELFYTLIWDGSELDIIKATHGVIRTWAYAEKCTHNYMKEGLHYSCDSGQIKHNGTIEKTCGVCNGTGLKIPTSSQDIIYFGEPRGSYNDSVPLDKMVHQLTIDDSILTMRREDLEMLEAKIIKTVFNSNYITQNEITKTATEIRIDQEGVVSALGAMGSHVSKLFIWKTRCIANYIKASAVDIFHGFSMNFSLDTVESLLEDRKRAIEAGAPKYVIEVIDYAIMKKQHIDNPNYIDRLVVWEQFKPFSDVETNEKLAMIAMLPQEHPKRQLYFYFREVKRQVEESIGDKFYTMKFDKQRELIYQTLKKVKLSEEPKVA